MADAQANINVNINATQALSQIRALQNQISMFHSSLARGNASAVTESLALQRNLVNSIKATGQFSARMTTVATSTESFTNALEKNQLSMRQYFRYAGAASGGFGRIFGKEFDLVNRTAIERVKTLQTQYIKMGRDANGAMRAIAVRPLTLDMQNLSTQTAIAAQRTQLFNQLIKQGSTNLLNWGKNTQWAGRQLMVGFTIPLSIMAGVAIREFRKIEEQAITFRRVYGDMFTTRAETDKALENVRELANEFTRYGIAVEETVGVAAKVAQMGNVGRALEEQVTQATRLSVLGGITQMEALDTTISLTNAFGVSIEQLSNQVNLLNAAENQTILSIQDFNDAIPKAGTVVKQLGGDVGDLAVFLTAMREAGISANEAGNALKTSLGRLINPTRQARQDLAAMGIDVVGIVESNVGNLSQTVFDLAFALDELEPLQRSRAIERLFGKFQFTRMSALLANITDTSSQANKMLQITGQSAEQLGILAERELSRVEESTSTKLQKSLEELKASLAPLGEAFIELLTPLIKWGTKILESFNNLGDGGKKVVSGLIAGLGLVAPAALMIIGLIANGIANMTKLFHNMQKGYIALQTGGRGAARSSEYLTEKHLQAQAAANTLGGAHDRLTGSFTAENSALRNLITTYEAAIAAQSRLAASAGAVAAASSRNMAAMAGAGASRALILPGAARASGSATSAAGLVRPTGYNTGVLSVPGPKGAGDIVPALLSPGEAVIPAKAAAKYAPVIRGMIAGNLPGFEFGGFVNESNTLGNYHIRDEQNNIIRTVQIQGKDQNAVMGVASQLDSHRNSLSAQTGQPINRMLAEELSRSRSPVTGTSLDKALRAVGYSNLTGVARVHLVEPAAMFDNRSQQQMLRVAQGLGMTNLANEISAGRVSTLSAVTNFAGVGPSSWNVSGATGARWAAWIREDPGRFMSNISENYGLRRNDPDLIRMANAAARRFEQNPNEIFTDQPKTLPSGARTRGMYSLMSQSADEAIIRNDKASPAVKQVVQDARTNVSVLRKGSTSGGAGFARIPKAMRGTVLNVDGRQVQFGSTMGRFSWDEKTQQYTPSPTRVDPRTGAVVPTRPVQSYDKVASSNQDHRSADRFLMRRAPENRTGIGQPGLSDRTPGQIAASSRVEERLQQKTALRAGQAYNTGFAKGAGKGLARNIAMEGGWRSPNPFISGLGSDDGRAYARNFITSVQGTSGTGTSAASLILPGATQAPAAPSTGLVIPRVSGGTPVPLGVGAPTPPPVMDPAQGQQGRAFWGRVGNAVAVGASKASAATGPARDRLMNSVLRPLGRAIERNAAAAGTRLSAAGSRVDGWRAAMGAGGGGRDAGGQTRQQPPPGQPGRFASAGMGISIVGGMALGGLAMQENKTGDFVRENFAGLSALMALPFILPLLKNPFIALLAAVGAAVAGFIYFNSEMEKAAKRGQELASAMSMSSNNIQEISEFTGTVSATELRERRTQELMTGSEFTQSYFGKDFLQTPVGEKIISDIELMQERGMSPEETGVAIGRNLTQAIVQGVLSPEQAFSIAAALGQELQDYTIPAKIVGQIVSYIGPNGRSLEDDPIEVALRVQEDVIAEQKAFDQYSQSLIEANDVAREEANRGWEDTAVIVGSTIAGISAGIGVVAGWTGVGAVVAGIGLAIGGIVGGIGAVAKGLNEMDEPSLWDRFKENVELRNASIALGIEALSQSQQTLDIIDQQYRSEMQRLDALEKQAITEDEILQIEEERVRLAERRDSARQEAIRQNEELVNNLMAQESRLDPGQFSEGLRVALEARYEDSTALAFYKDAFDQLEKFREEAEAAEDVTKKTFALRVQAELAAGNISWGAAYRLIDAFEADEDFAKDYNLFVNTVGSAQAALTIDLLDRLGVAPENYQYFINFLVNADDFDKAQRALSAFGDLRINFGFDVDLDEDAINQMTGFLGVLDEYPDTIPKEVVFDSNSELLGWIAQYWDIIAGSADSLDKSVIITFAAAISGANSDLINWWMTQSGNRPRGMPMSADLAERWLSNPQRRLDAAAEMLRGAGGITPRPGDITPSEEDLGGGGGAQKPPTSILDPIVKDLRDFLNLSQKATNTWESSLDAIIKFGAEGGRSVRGLSNQLRRAGISEPLIQKFLGMDPDEWEKRKRELFNFDGNTITGLTAAGRAVQQAFNEAAIAKATDQQRSLANSTRDQITAIRRLTAAGSDFKSAYQMVQDTALATAIATGKNTKAIRQLVREAKEAAMLVEELNRMNEEEERRSRLKKSLEEANKQFSQRAEVLKKLQAQAGQFTDAQIDLIFSNQDVMEVFLDPKIAPRELEKALRNAERQAELELSIRKLTLTGREGIVNEAFGQAMEAISAEERRIELEIEAEISAEQEIADLARREIADLEYIMDDYNAGLVEIQNQEELINETYEKRFDALDRISDINDKIAGQQERQLDLAEALSRGDIAAAAKAAQDLRNQQQRDSIDDQRKMMEQRQRIELESLRSTAGLSRKELEREIKELEDRIFRIDQDRLRPAEEYIRLAQLRMKDEMESLEVLGRTRKAWEALQNEIDVARTRSWKFMEDLARAAEMIPQLLSEYQAPKPAAAPAPAPAPAPAMQPVSLSRAQRDANSAAWRSHEDQVRRGQQQPHTFRYPFAIRGPDGKIVEVGASGRAIMGGTVVGGRGRGYAAGGQVQYLPMGGQVKYMPMGGKVPYMSLGGMFKTLGSDTVPAMLTPGEFVIRRPAVNEFGVDNLEKINRGTYSNGSVYNYSLSVNVKSDANPDQIANTVMREIKRVDSKRIRDTRL